jgi:hypothetical protein
VDDFPPSLRDPGQAESPGEVRAEARTLQRTKPSSAGCDFFDFSHCFGGRKAVKSIGQGASSGVLRLRAVNPLLGDRSARRFAQDDGLVGVLKSIPVGCAKNKKNQKSHNLSAEERVAETDPVVRPKEARTELWNPTSREKRARYGPPKTSGQDKLIRG